MTVFATTRPLNALLSRLAGEAGLLVEVTASEGSVPRVAGAWIAVFTDATIGTIGGGNLEFDAIAEARLQLTGGSARGAVVERRFALGPSLGQCCGGVVRLRFQSIGLPDAPALAKRLTQNVQTPLRPIALFGGGHVGHALVQVLAGLPFAVTWIDSRDSVFPLPVPDGVVCEQSDPVQAAVASLAPQSKVLIMSFSHAEDLDILVACLRRQREKADLPYIGLIGSRTKWAAFKHRLQARGFTPAEIAQVTSPIGVPGVVGKEPAVIAVAVAAQLLQRP
jgi:xanthine dehydrogenase accessory factor